MLLLILPSVKFRVNPWLVFCLFFLPWLILLPSVKFRVNPWQMLPLLLVLISVFFRVNPWQMLLLSLLLILNSVAILLISCNLSPNLDISEIL
jgi:hypothetical protein